MRKKIKKPPPEPEPDPTEPLGDEEVCRTLYPNTVDLFSRSCQECNKIECLNYTRLECPDGQIYNAVSHECQNCTDWFNDGTLTCD